MSRSDANRRYNNLVQYQLRPMLLDRRMSDAERIGVLKRIIREANRFRYESGVVAGSGTREEIADLLVPWLKPEHWSSIEVKDWLVRMVRAFGASVETE
jgi:hypothetical protein